MLSNEQLVCLDLQKILTERIKGKIFVSKDYDLLTIHISPGKGINYKRNINNISKMNVEGLANEIEYDYRKYITDLYFIRKEN